MRKEDVKLIMPSKGNILISIRRMYKGGFVIAAGRMRLAYNKLSGELGSKDRISKKEIL